MLRFSTLQVRDVYKRQQLKQNPQLWKELIVKMQTPTMLAVFDTLADYQLDNACLLYTSDALSTPEGVRQAYSDEEFVALTRELTEVLHRNRTIDWNRTEIGRAHV